MNRSPASPDRFSFASLHRLRRWRLGTPLAGSILLFLAACSSPPGPTRIDNLPMYGQPAVPRPTVLKQADEHFIATAVTGFGGNRQLASIAWTDQAERFLEEGNLDFAMRRYNQAWLLDENNYAVYWGFGRVMALTGKPAEALVHLRKALALCNEPSDDAAIQADIAKLPPSLP